MATDYGYESLKQAMAGERITMSMPYAGFRAMQVCVAEDVTDVEILEFCNRVNPQQVSGGWHTVVRDLAHAEANKVEAASIPGRCKEMPTRWHKIVLCM